MCFLHKPKVISISTVMTFMYSAVNSLFFINTNCSLLVTIQNKFTTKDVLCKEMFIMFIMAV